MYAEIKEAFARAGILLSDKEKSHEPQHSGDHALVRVTIGNGK